MRVLAVGAAAILLASCGYVGDPLPPALSMPQKIADLRALEYGEKIVIEFTVSERSTEDLILPNLRGAELRVEGGDVKEFAVPLDKPGAVRHEIPARDWVGNEVKITARAFGPKGRPSDWSNPLMLRVIPPLEPPVNFKATESALGVHLTWSSPAARYRLFRDKELLATGEGREYVDQAIEYEKTYEYRVQVFAEENQQSVISAPLPVKPKDSYPPAVPSGLTALAAPNSIELTWDRNQETDLKGYLVYRAAGEGEFERIASDIETPAYSDRTVEAGKRYRYAVSSVDQVGNESRRSAVVEVTAQ
jgi:hypothetical protein